MTDYRKMQEELEDGGIAAGIERARKYLTRDLKSGDGLVNNSTVKDMMDVALSRTCEALKAWLEDQHFKSNHRLRVYVECLGVEAISFIALSAACHAVSNIKKHRDVCLAIGQAVEDEARYSLFRAEAYGLYAHRMEKLKTTLDKRFRKASMNQALAWAGVDTALYEMPFEEKAALGLALLDGIIVEVTGLFEVESVRTHNGKTVTQDKRISWSVAATDAMWQRVTPGTTFWSRPVNIPCVIPPKDWSATQRGGYHFKMAGKHPLVRKGGPARNKAVRETATPVLWQALNHLQGVRWSINEEVLKVMRAAINLPHGGFGFPAAKVEVPAKLPDTAFALMNDDDKRAYRSTRREAYDRALKANSERADALLLLDTASDFVGHPMYYPYSMDFRGRIYAIASYLTPYGSDSHRGLLLHFAGEGAELGQHGMMWLAVHGANTIDKMNGVKVSKLSNEDRVRFISDNEEMILAAAADPLGNNWWGELENPWQTLAFCLEWAKLKAWTGAGNTASSFHSELPVQMDGTCNGAQHFAAMFRDEVGGSAVNLVPGDTPEDLYSRVAEELLAQMVSEAAAGDEMAMLWSLSKMIDRTLLKRCVMTYFYGSKQFRFAKYLIATIEADPQMLERANAVFGFENRESKLPGVASRRVPRYIAGCQYLAGKMDVSLSGVVKGAHDGMLWLRSWALVIGNRNLKTAWTVPITGMVAEQAYMEQDITQVKTTMFGTHRKATVWTDSTTVRKKKQATAVSPNVIHSLDTAHLMLTLAMLPGIPVGAVHDSYWTLAGYTDTLRTATRAAFVQLYSLDIASMLEEQFNVLCPDLTDKERKALAPKPSFGSLQIEAVLDSEYFFA